MLSIPWNETFNMLNKLADVSTLHGSLIDKSMKIILRAKLNNR